MNAEKDLTSEDLAALRNRGENEVELFKHARKVGWTDEQLAFYINSQRGTAEERTAASIADHRGWLTRNVPAYAEVEAVRASEEGVFTFEGQRYQVIKLR